MMVIIIPYSELKAFLLVVQKVVQNLFSYE